MTFESPEQSDEQAARLDQFARNVADSNEVNAVRRESRLVFGSGNPLPRIVLVGEAPGADEERQGKPFVGRAGQLLDAALRQAGLDRSQLWITNVVKIRPTETAANGRRRNRPPTPAERAAFRPWLEKELEILRPCSVVCLGATAAAALLGRPVKISTERGQWLAGPGGVRVLTTYHPAYLLRPFRSRDENFRALVEDLRRASSDE